MSGIIQPGLRIVDPLEQRIMPQDGSAYFTLNRMASDGRMLQKAYRLRLIETVIRELGQDIDVYLSQGLFTRPCRRAVHLAWMTHGYVDLDVYRTDRWRGLSPDDMVREILWFCADVDIPPPSVILSSGRGYYCKWFWAGPIARGEAGRAVAVNRSLARRLVQFRADPCAVDVSRILRVVGTVNSKSGAPVAIVWISDAGDGGPITYNFDAFARAILPGAVAASDPEHAPHDRLGIYETRRLMTWHERITRGFSREHWHWGVLEDVRALAAARYPAGLVLPGARDLYGHLAACQLARVIMPGPLFHEIVATARTLLPDGYIDQELKRHCSALLDRATRAADGERVTFRNGHRTPIYTYSKTRLMDLLEVTPDDERSMTRLISDGEKYRRQVKARRAAGMMERVDYKARAAERRPIVLMMRAQGAPFSEIAAKLGISKGEAHRLAQP